MRPGHFRWPTNVDIPLFLELVDSAGNGVLGKTPQVAIRRYRDPNGYLDNYYWDGGAFGSPEFFFNMTEVDPVGYPGLYTHLFIQTLIGVETQYLVYYKSSDPGGFQSETHFATNEIYVPAAVDAPVIVGPDTVMGQLALIKDGGTGLFEGDKDSLHFLTLGFERVLGLLHHNALLDRQQYDTNNQLTYARLRVFENAAAVPASPGGTELGTQEYEIRAEYDGVNLKNYSLRQIR